MMVYLFLFLIFFLDIFSSPNTKLISLVVALIFPATYLLIRCFKKGKISLPEGSGYFLLFIVASLISTWFSVDKQESFEKTLMYLSAFFMFIVAFNDKKILEKSYRNCALISSVIYIAVFALNRFLNLELFSDPSSLFYYYGHNQMGNILILSFFLLLPSFQVMYLLPIIFLSYSRSTFIALVGSIILFGRHLIRKKIMVITLVVFLMVGIIVATSSRLLLKQNTLLGSRETYFSYAVSSIKQKPVLGIGPGNFYYAASQGQTNYDENTSSSHNLALDLIVENGIVGTIMFMIFLAYILKNGHKSPFFIPFFALTLVFMMDLTHIFTSFLMLWFFLAGLAINEKISYKTGPALIVLYLIACQIIILGRLLYSLGFYEKAVRLYPVYRDAYAKTIVTSIDNKDSEKAAKYMKTVERLYGDNFLMTLKLARYYEFMGELEKSAHYYRKTLELRPFFIVADGIVLEKAYVMEGESGGYYNAQIKTAAMLNEIVSSIPPKIRQNNIMTDRIRNFCDKHYLKCSYR